jgi:hypothetical protein
MSAEDRVAYWQRRASYAERRLEFEKEHNESTRQWANKAFDEERRLRDRCVELYGLAARYGATDDELHHGWTGWPIEVAS